MVNGRQECFACIPLDKTETLDRAAFCGFDSDPASWGFLAAAGVVVTSNGARRLCIARISFRV